MGTTILARGTTPTDRDRSIDTICTLLDNNPAGPDADTLRTLHEFTEERASTVAEDADTGTRLYVRTSDATTRDRQGPNDPARAAMRRAADDTVDGHVPALIIDSLARIDTDAIASLVADHDVAVIDAHHRLTIHVKPGRESFPPALKRALDVMTGTAEHADALLAGIEWGGGRPPLGCTSNGGRLAPDDDYDAVCWTLQQVADDRMSKTDAAEDLDCTRKTIDNALERRELYRIE